MHCLSSALDVHCCVLTYLAKYSLKKKIRAVFFGLGSLKARKQIGGRVEIGVNNSCLRAYAARCPRAMKRIISRWAFRTRTGPYRQ